MRKFLAQGFGWAAVIAAFAIGIFLYGLGKGIEPRAKIASSPIVQTVNLPEISLTEAKATSPEISTIEFVGVAFNANSAKGATALLKVGTSGSQLFQESEFISSTLKLKEIHPEKVVISTVNGYPDFNVALGRSMKDSPQANVSDASAKVSGVPDETQALPGFIKNGGLNRPRDEKAIAANNAAFLSAVQNMKPN